jgi:2-keto-4-pentenoate hydratase
VLESGLTDPLRAARNSMLADLQMHGALIFGPACEEWRQVDFTQEKVILTVDGTVRADRTGSNTAGDLLRLLPWLANHGAARTGGLRAGQWITTGSWTGFTIAMSGSSAEVRFSTLGRVGLRFQ